MFTDANLARYRVVVFLNTTGEVLDAGEQAAFERFIRGGGGFVGIHSATDTVLVRIDETTYRGGRMGADHPLSWYHAYDGGRAWYTALGHTAASYSEPLFLDHLRGGITWAAGPAPE